MKKKVKYLNLFFNGCETRASVAFRSISLEIDSFSCEKTILVGFLSPAEHETEQSKPLGQILHCKRHDDLETRTQIVSFD